MIYYIVDQNNNIVGKEKVGSGVLKPLPSDNIRIESDLDIININDYQYIDGEFALKPAVPYTLQLTEQTSYDINIMTFPNHCTIDIFGPGISQRLVTEYLEFESTRKGIFRFTLTARGYKKTTFEVSVR